MLASDYKRGLDPLRKNAAAVPRPSLVASKGDPMALSAVAFLPKTTPSP